MTRIALVAHDDEKQEMIEFAQSHESYLSDISALLRICDVHDTPMATTRTSAEYLLAGVAQDDGVDLAA